MEEEFEGAGLSGTEKDCFPPPVVEGEETLGWYSVMTTLNPLAKISNRSGLDRSTLDSALV